MRLLVDAMRYRVLAEPDMSWAGRMVLVHNSFRQKVSVRGQRVHSAEGRRHLILYVWSR